MEKKKTSNDQGIRLTFKTSNGTRVLTPDRLVYVGYSTDPGSKGRMELAYISKSQGQLCVEQLAYRSMAVLPLPDNGPLLRIHRQLFINIDQVEHYDKDLRITLNQVNERCFKVGRTFRKAFFRALGKAS